MHVIVAHGGKKPAEAGAFSKEERPVPVAQGRDILVKVQAAAINPVDTKVFERMPAGAERILGWDACGVVEAVGPEVTGFKAGDQVYYAGDLTRDGSNAEYQLVDERLAGKAPASLSVPQTASLPLTTLTAYEGLFDRLGFVAEEGANKGATLLVIGGAGGVGSMIIQLAAWAGLTVIATAGRPESAQWCRELGASAVIGRDNLAERLAAEGISQVDAIYCTTHLEEHWLAMSQVIAPQGRICMIDDPDAALDIRVFKQKSVRLCWEFMYTRSMFQTADMERQGMILEHVARLIDAGRVRTTLAKTIEGLSVESVQSAHLQQRTGRMVGKQVIVF